jgi:hypothetical protein
MRYGAAKIRNSCFYERERFIKRISAVQMANGRGTASPTFWCKLAGDITDVHPSVGIDVGLKHFFVDSNGENEDAPKYFKQCEKQLTRCREFSLVDRSGVIVGIKLA